MEAAAVANPGEHSDTNRTQEECKYKNRLQELAQRALSHLPVYQTFNGGSQHIRQFRSTVIVDGTTYVSPYAFQRRKEAEQYVAKYAFQNAIAKITQEGAILIDNDKSFCKAILHEYATKMKKELPTYASSRVESLLPAFTTSVVFDGKTFVGGLGRNKKEAEQIGARTVIKWILGQSDMGTTMAEIIKSKSKFINEINGGSGSIMPQDNNMPSNFVNNHSGNTVTEAVETHISSVVPHECNVPLQVPGDTHHVVDGSNGGSTHIVPTDGNISVPTVESSIPPTAAIPKEVEVILGSVVEGNIVPTPQHQNNQPLDTLSNNPCLEQIVEVQAIQIAEVKLEVLLDPPMSHLDTPNPTSGEKRSRKNKRRNKKGSNSKKIRMDE